MIIAATATFLEFSHLMLDGEVSFSKKLILEVIKLMFGGGTIFFILFDDLGFSDFLKKRRIGAFSDKFTVFLCVSFVLFFDDLSFSFFDLCHELDVMFV